MTRTRLLIVDDHPLILAGIRSLLGARYDLVGECGDGRSAVGMALRLRPNVILLDVGLPLLNGIDAARQIRREWPAAKILFLSMHANSIYVREAFNAGAAGYVLKSSAAEELETAIRTVLRGGIYTSPALGEDVLEDLLTSGGIDARTTVKLTDRQREVLQMVAEGRGNKEIAQILNVSPKTVDFHRGKIMRKVGVHTVAELTAFALKSGIIASPSRPRSG